MRPMGLQGRRVLLCVGALLDPHAADDNVVALVRNPGHREGGDRGQSTQVFCLVKAHCKIEGVINVDCLAVRADPDGARVLANVHGAALAFNLLVIIVDDPGDIHIIGAGVDRIESFAVRR